MKIKRVIAVCLAAVMVVLPLSGCGNSSGEQQGNGSGHGASGQPTKTMATAP